MSLSQKVPSCSFYWWYGPHPRLQIEILLCQKPWAAVSFDGPARIALCPLATNRLSAIDWLQHYHTSHRSHLHSLHYHYHHNRSKSNYAKKSCFVLSLILDQLSAWQKFIRFKICFLFCSRAVQGNLCSLPTSQRPLLDWQEAKHPKLLKRLIGALGFSDISNTFCKATSLAHSHILWTFYNASSL